MAYILNLSIKHLPFKKMKTQLKFLVCVLAGTIAVSTACKAQSSNASHIIDSLKITDADEIKICTLYDDVVTEYLKEWKQYTTNNTTPTAAQSAEINKKFQQKEKEIRPQIESFRKRIAANTPQLMNFVQFCQYESMRVYGVVSKYQQGMYKNYPVPANH